MLSGKPVLLLLYTTTNNTFSTNSWYLFAFSMHHSDVDQFVPSDPVSLHIYLFIIFHCDDV